MSLKANLIKEIQERKFLSYDDLINFCRIWGYKVSNAERRMREAIEIIEPTRNKKGAVVGYRPRTTQRKLF